MNLKSIFLLLLSLIILLNCSSDDSPTPVEQTPEETAIYFPPIATEPWETKSPIEAGWNESQVQPLLDYLEEKHTKGFIMLHDGKIVVESYMNGHTPASTWYWASAGKTLTSTVSGIAQAEGLLDIQNKVSDYLGAGWTSATIDQENLITCKDLLSMTSGLNNTLGDDVSPANLQYIADAGTRWAYHNVYVKMQDVVASASNQTWSDYFDAKLRNRIGMTGAWVNMDALSIYWSDTRSMARFGLMIYAKGKWGSEQIVPEAYLNEATNTSQNINLSYGYLWWLNGKSSYHLPQFQIEYPGELVPNSPDDMYAAMGKNDQKIYIVPSRNLVIVRMGEVADPENPTFALSEFDDELWQHINALTE